MTEWIAGFTLGLVVAVVWVLIKMTDTLGGINRKLELLMKHSGLNLPELASREAQALAREGKKIEAIKRYREISGASLAEAKAAVERLQEGAGSA